MFGSILSPDAVTTVKSTLIYGIAGPLIHSGVVVANISLGMESSFGWVLSWSWTGLVKHWQSHSLTKSDTHPYSSLICV